MRDDHGEARDRPRHKRRRAIDHRAHRRVPRADHVIAGDHGAEPVREIDNLGTADSRVEIFIAARKAHDFVRKHRPANEQLIVIENQAVEFYGNFLREQAAGDLLDFIRGNRAELHECIGILPVMIENVAAARHAVDDRAADEFAQMRVVHRRVRAQRHEIIEGLHAGAERFLESVKHQRHRHAARAVRNQNEDAFSVERKRGERFGDEFARVVARQIRVGGSDSDRHAFLHRAGTFSRSGSSGSREAWTATAFQIPRSTRLRTRRRIRQPGISSRPLCKIVPRTLLRGRD